VPGRNRDAHVDVERAVAEREDPHPLPASPALGHLRLDVDHRGEEAPRRVSGVARASRAGPPERADPAADAVGRDDEVGGRRAGAMVEADVVGLLGDAGDLGGERHGAGR
jgi:hypothetical protein